MRKYPDSFTEIAGMTVGSASFLEHTYNKTEFTQKTMLSRTIGGDMRFGQSPDWYVVMHHLQ